MTASGGRLGLLAGLDLASSRVMLWRNSSTSSPSLSLWAFRDSFSFESFAAFEQAVRTLDQVLECVLVAGEVDYFLRIRVRDLAAFNRLHSERIIALPGVRQVRTFFVMNEIKTDGLLPV